MHNFLPTFFSFVFLLQIFSQCEALAKELFALLASGIFFVGCLNHPSRGHYCPQREVAMDTKFVDVSLKSQNPDKTKKKCEEYLPSQLIQL